MIRLRNATHWEAASWNGAYITFQNPATRNLPVHKAPNAETIELLFQNGLVNGWRTSFSYDAMRKRILSPKQMRIRPVGAAL